LLHEEMLVQRGCEVGSRQATLGCSASSILGITGSSAFPMT
jgi:hypothetical protein